MLGRGAVADLWQLTKPGITRLVLVTTAVGFYLASTGSFDWLLLIHALVGTGLLAGGTNALNQYAERKVDGAMKRTRNRPLPAGRIGPGLALLFSAGISVVGAVYLALWVNLLTAVLGVASLLIYIFAYTPLKRRTWWCTIVGAVPGAIPPMMGWTAVRGSVDVLAWVLFGIVFLWQMPHFYAIGWMYRQDYARAGFPMLPVVDEAGDARHANNLVHCRARDGERPDHCTRPDRGGLFRGGVTLGLAFWLSASPWLSPEPACRHGACSSGRCCICPCCWC